MRIIRWPSRRDRTKESVDPHAEATVGEAHPDPRSDTVVDRVREHEPRDWADRIAGIGGFARRVADRINPIPASQRVTIGIRGAAKGIAIKYDPRKLSRAVGALRELASVDVAGLAAATARGTKEVTRALKLPLPWVAKNVHQVTAAVRDIARNFSPRTAQRLSADAVRSAQSVVAEIDPREVTAAVRRIAQGGSPAPPAAGDDDGIGKTAREAVRNLGRDRAIRVASEVIRVIKVVVARLDPDQVGKVVGEIVERAKSATGRDARFRLFGLLANIWLETGRAFKKVSKTVEPLDVVVVILVVLATMPELLVALGVSAAVIKVVVTVAQGILRVLPDREATNVASEGVMLRTSGISDRVSVGGTGLEGVTVSLTGGPDTVDMTTVTDATGQYAFAKLRAGDYQVGILGYDTDAYEFEVTSQNVRVAPGETANVPF